MKLDDEFLGGAGCLGVGLDIGIVCGRVGSKGGGRMEAEVSEEAEGRGEFSCDDREGFLGSSRERYDESKKICNDRGRFSMPEILKILF